MYKRGLKLTADQLLPFFECTVSENHTQGLNCDTNLLCPLVKKYNMVVIYRNFTLL
jgi:hypothetical protein